MRITDFEKFHEKKFLSGYQEKTIRRIFLKSILYFGEKWPNVTNTKNLTKNLTLFELDQKF